jgi:molybdopterin-guanine dinucleotide biosynthesis protein A
MIEHVADALRPLVASLIVAGASRGFRPQVIGAFHLEDLRPGQGPLAGIETVLASGIASHYLVATCDQPFLTTALLRRLLPPSGLPSALCTSEDDDSMLPFPCLLSAACLNPVREALDGGERSPRRWLCSVGVGWRIVKPAAVRLVRSINTTDELVEVTSTSGPERKS